MNTQRIALYNARKADATTVWLLFLFLGWSYGSLGKIGLQLLYYITLGGFGFWMFIRLFTLQGSIRDYNMQIAKELGLSSEERIAAGLV